MLDAKALAWAEALDPALIAKAASQRHVQSVIEDLVSVVCRRSAEIERLAQQRDPVFQQATAIMGTQNWNQEECLRVAIMHVLSAPAATSAAGEGSGVAVRPHEQDAQHRRPADAVGGPPAPKPGA